MFCHVFVQNKTEVLKKGFLIYSRDWQIHKHLTQSAWLTDRRARHSKYKIHFLSPVNQTLCRGKILHIFYKVHERHKGAEGFNIKAAYIWMIKKIILTISKFLSSFKSWSVILRIEGTTSFNWKPCMIPDWIYNANQHSNVYYWWCLWTLMWQTKANKD